MSAGSVPGIPQSPSFFARLAGIGASSTLPAASVPNAGAISPRASVIAATRHQQRAMRGSIMVSDGEESDGDSGIPTPIAEGDEIDEREIVHELSAELSHEELRIRASILSAEVTKDSNGEYVRYTLRVETGPAPDISPASAAAALPAAPLASTGLHWKVQRRYREFQNLHEKLVDVFGKDHLPALPKKSLRRNLKPDYIRKKKLELSRYLTDLMLDSAVMSSELLSHFLLRSIQDVIRSHAVEGRVFAERASDLKSAESDVIKLRREKRQAESALSAMTVSKEAVEAAAAELLVKEKAALEARVKEAEESAEIANQETVLLHAAWEEKFAELTAHAKTLRQEKKTALGFVKDLDALVRKLKMEKRVLVKEVKENRVQLAALGATADFSALDATPGLLRSESELASFAAAASVDRAAEPAAAVASPSDSPKGPAFTAGTTPESLLLADENADLVPSSCKPHDDSPPAAASPSPTHSANSPSLSHFPAFGSTVASPTIAASLLSATESDSFLDPPPVADSLPVMLARVRSRSAASRKNTTGDVGDVEPHLVISVQPPEQPEPHAESRRDSSSSPSSPTITPEPADDALEPPAVSGDV